MMRTCSLTLFLLLVVFVPVLLLSVEPAAAADEVFGATSAITLPSGQKVTSFDISFVDPVISLYILADRTNAAVDVVDTDTNTVLTQLKAGFAGTQKCKDDPTASANDCRGPNGVLIVDHREVWAGDGPVFTCTGSPPVCKVTTFSSVKVIDLFNQQLTHTILTGGKKRADELCHDPRHHLVLMANDADSPPFITLIATGRNTVFPPYTVVKRIAIPEATNGIEQCQWSRRTGKFYLNIPEVNGPGDNSAPGAVLVISPETMEIERTFNIPHDKCAGPQGMAIGPDEQILLGCNASSSSVIINERSGEVVAALPNEGGCDEVWFNEGDDHYFLARSAAVGPNQLLGVVDARDHHEDQSVFTAHKTIPGRNAHSVAADPVMNQVYVPIPAGVSTVCSSAGGSDALGCIAVFRTTSDDRPVPR
jgi:hypothetical protein